MSLASQEELTRAGVPHLDRTVLTARGQSLIVDIGTESDDRDSIRMSASVEDFLVGLKIPHLNRAAASCAGQARLTRVRSEGHAGEVGGTASEKMKFLS